MLQKVSYISDALCPFAFRALLLRLDGHRMQSPSGSAAHQARLRMDTEGIRTMITKRVAFAIPVGPGGIGAIAPAVAVGALEPTNGGRP